jgi:protease I
MSSINNKKVALLVDNGFEESEFKKPFDAIKKAGGIPHLISPQKSKVKSWAGEDWGPEYDVDKKLGDANAADYDAIVLPGGQINPDLLRVNKDALAFVQHFIDNNKLIAAICHAPWILVELDYVKGKKMTSYHSIIKDVKNAGADWVDKEVVIDGNLITSRSPKDLNAFNEAIIEMLSISDDEKIV